MQAEADTRILVVDDYPLLRHLFLHMLLRAGYERAEGMESSLEAWHACERGDVALALIDVGLPEVEGFPNGCALGVRLARRWPDLRVLFISGYEREDLGNRCPPGFPLLTKGMRTPSQLLAQVATAIADPPWIPPEDWPCP